VSRFCVKDGQKFLFIGDSITDCDRRGAERPFGNGYVSLFIELQRWMFPGTRVAYVNMGIGGNTVLDLKDRWADDVLREKPDWLSVHIGINDCHRFLGGEKDHAPDEFSRNYDRVLSRTREETKAQFLLMEPFYISADRSGLGPRTEVLKRLPEYISTVHGMAKKYKARLVRTHHLFQRHIKHTPPGFFCPEPVHPFRNGHLFIALEAMKALTDP
jgi:lysophospholipase L1-like esterase